MLKVNSASAIAPGKTFEEALAVASESFEWFGKLSLDHIQLCPQHRERLTIEVIDRLQSLYPNTQFRLHANCFVHEQRHIQGLDLNNATKENIGLFKKLAELNQHCKAPAYSLHAGYKRDGSRENLTDKLKRLEDLFDCPVAVEPLYPSDKDYLLDSFDDLQWLLDNEINFALDISHYQIISRHNNLDPNWQLLKDLLDSDSCLEIHLSDNNGTSDQHSLITHKTWYWDSLISSKAISNPNCTLFSEGNQGTSEHRIRHAKWFQDKMKMASLP